MNDIESLEEHNITLTDLIEQLEEDIEAAAAEVGCAGDNLPGYDWDMKYKMVHLIWTVREMFSIFCANIDEMNPEDYEMGVGVVEKATISLIKTILDEVKTLIGKSRTMNPA